MHVMDEDLPGMRILVHSPKMLAIRLVEVGKDLARHAECLTEEETAECITSYLSVIIAELTGIEALPEAEFQVPLELN